MRSFPLSSPWRACSPGKRRSEISSGRSSPRIRSAGTSTTLCISWPRPARNGETPRAPSRCSPGRPKPDFPAPSASTGTRCSPRSAAPPSTLPSGKSSRSGTEPTALPSRTFRESEGGRKIGGGDGELSDVADDREGEHPPIEEAFGLFGDVLGGHRLDARHHFFRGTDPAEVELLARLHGHARDRGLQGQHHVAFQVLLGPEKLPRAHSLVFQALQLPQRYLKESREVLRGAGRVDRLVSAQPEGVERRGDRIGETALLPHLLEEPRRHPAAQNDVKQVGCETVVGGLRGPFDPQAEMRLAQTPARLQEQILVASRPRDAPLARGIRDGAGGPSAEKLSDFREAFADPHVTRDRNNEVVGPVLRAVVTVQIGQTDALDRFSAP